MIQNLRPYAVVPQDHHRDHVHLALDLRTTEEIATDEAAELADLRETLTGLPARPSVTR